MSSEELQLIRDLIAEIQKNTSALAAIEYQLMLFHKQGISIKR